MQIEILVIRPDPIRVNQSEKLVTGMEYDEAMDVLAGALWGVKGKFRALAINSQSMETVADVTGSVDDALFNDEGGPWDQWTGAVMEALGIDWR